MDYIVTIIAVVVAGVDAQLQRQRPRARRHRRVQDERPVADAASRFGVQRPLLPSGSLFFIDANHVIHTPIADCFLNGITRQTVIGMAQANQMKVIERHIMPEEIADMKECFLTGTAAEVTPVSQIGEHHFIPSETTRSLVNEYEKIVRRI